MEKGPLDGYNISINDEERKRSRTKHRNSFSYKGLIFIAKTFFSKERKRLSVE
jgi:hypothetical protein